MPFIPPNDAAARSKVSQCAYDTWRPWHLSRVWKAKTFQSDIISYSRYTKLCTKWCSADLQFWSAWGERGSQLRHPCEWGDLGANQLWAGKDKPSPTWGSLQGSASTCDKPGDLVVWIHCEQINSLSWDHQVRWQRQNKPGFTTGNTGKLSNSVGNIFFQVLVLKIYICIEKLWPNFRVYRYFNLFYKRFS